MALGWSSVEIGIGFWGEGLSGPAIGSVAGGSICRCNVGVCTLGDVVTDCNIMVGKI